MPVMQDGEHRFALCAKHTSASSTDSRADVDPAHTGVIALKIQRNFALELFAGMARGAAEKSTLAVSLVETLSPKPGAV